MEMSGWHITMQSEEAAETRFAERDTSPLFGATQECPSFETMDRAQFVFFVLQVLGRHCKPLHSLQPAPPPKQTAALICTDRCRM